LNRTTARRLNRALPATLAVATIVATRLLLTAPVCTAPSRAKSAVVRERGCCTSPGRVNRLPGLETGQQSAGHPQHKAEPVNAVERLICCTVGKTGCAVLIELRTTR
jgi:hypothetical protein